MFWIRNQYYLIRKEEGTTDPGFDIMTARLYGLKNKNKNKIMFYTADEEAACNVTSDRAFDDYERITKTTEHPWPVKAAFTFLPFLLTSVGVFNMSSDPIMALCVAMLVYTAASKLYFLFTKGYVLDLSIAVTKARLFDGTWKATHTKRGEIHYYKIYGLKGVVWQAMYSEATSKGRVLSAFLQKDKGPEAYQASREWVKDHPEKTFNIFIKEFQNFFRG